ncbi:hypothetical protein B0H13DRAFT_2328018 [Mycena leptocephala]|nr:hypothetical protein B0H13DRAFT_2328018 [Mycena leptocephala]
MATTPLRPLFFVLNVGKEDWQKDRVAMCFEAALHLDAPFSLSISFNMSSIRSDSPDDVALLCSYLAAFGNHSRMFR